MKKIKKIKEMARYDDGIFFEYIEFPKLDFESSQKDLIHSDKANLLVNAKKIIYDDNSDYILPISEIIEVLPDRTGFIVIYGEQPDKYSTEKSYPWFFERPNNAAVYNSDGSLRFQIKNPFGDYIFSFAQPSIKYPDFPSVILNDLEYPNSGSFCYLYAIDPNNAELLETGQQIRW